MTINTTKDFDWPRITVVTPSYNQGQFLEQTIKSVLDQEYPNLEYIIMDGGSTDNSVEIIRKYEKYLTYWQTQPDGGQSAAINTGFSKGSGIIFGWLNSDDFLKPGALQHIISMYQENQDASMWIGACEEVLLNNGVTVCYARIGPVAEVGNWATSTHFYQPACFFSAEKFYLSGKLDNALHYAMDVDLWVRLMCLGKVVVTENILAGAHIYPLTKTLSEPDLAKFEYITICIKNGFPETARKVYYKMMQDFPADRPRLVQCLDATCFKYLLKYMAGSFVKRIYSRVYRIFSEFDNRSQ